MTYHEVDGESEIWGHLLRWRKERHREGEGVAGSEMESLKVLMVVGKKVMMWRKCCDMAGDLA